MKLSYTYAGIGARKTPADMLARCTHAARVLAGLGYVLRSGAADGADLAFEQGAGEKQIFLPWRGFNGSTSARYTPSAKAFEIAEDHHRAWESLSPAVRKLMARNTHQILGEHVDSPADFVVCWTPGGRIVGGTGQALRVAESYNVPVFNLAADPELHHLFVWLSRYGAIK